MLRRLLTVSLSVLSCLLVAVVTTTAAQAVTIERVSSPVFYIDDGHGDAYRSMYAAYRITNDDGVDYTNLFVVLGGFATGANVTLAATEDGVLSTGPITNGASRVVYFYLTAAAQKLTPENHTVAVHLTRPFTTPLASRTFALTTESTITASSNKVLTVNYDPLNPELGGELWMTITGETGTIGLGGNFAFTPASRIDWPSHAFQLVGTELRLGTNAPILDRLWVQPSSTANQAYTITYRFRVACITEGTPISMLNHIDSGNNNKHNDPILLPVAPVPPPTESPLILTRFPTLLNAERGSLVLHTFSVINTGTRPVTFDDLWDRMLPGPLGPDLQPRYGAYVTGSSTLNGAPFADPSIVGGHTLHWSSSFPLGPGESLTFTFQVAYPEVDGNYVHVGWGEVSSSAIGLTCGNGVPTRIDTTSDLNDDAPATATIAVGVLDATDDIVRAAEGTPLVFPVTELLANDGTITPSTFALLSTTTTGGGSVTYDMSTGLVTYTAPHGVTTDGFSYRICGAFDPAICETASVQVLVNRAPVQQDLTVYNAVGSAFTDVAVATAYSDPDGDNLGVVSILATTGGTATIVGQTIRFAPPTVASAGIWTITYDVCDVGEPTACDRASLTVVHNDPPLLQSFLAAQNQQLMVAFGDDRTVAFEDILISLGQVAVDNPADGDDDGIGSVLVSSSPTGPWNTLQVLPDGTICRVENDLDVVLTADQDASTSACHVRVCEELPANDTRVCSVARLDTRTVECLGDGDCDPGLVCDPDTYTCVPCDDDAIYPDVDSGCWVAKPICDYDFALPTCVECQDTAPGNAIDVGCNLTKPVCDRAHDGGPACVECLTNDDCLDGQVCDPSNNTCVACLDTEPPGGIDQGCETIINACEGAGDAAGCVDCQSDPDCAIGDVCDVPNRTCEDCLPTESLDDIDPGCDGAEPQCIVGANDRWNCVECVRDEDCEPQDFCELSQHVCLPRDIVDARNDLYVTPQGVTLQIVSTATGVLGNDIIPIGAVASVAVVPGSEPNPGLVGTLVLNTDGTLSFAPRNEYVGTITFDYQLTTLAGGRDTATVTIIVNGAPVANDDGATTPEDTAILVAVTANDTDPNIENGGQPLTVRAVTVAPTHGTATIVAPGSIRYRPNPDYHGSDSLTYEVCDPHGACDTAVVRINVTPVNDAPVGVDDVATTPEDTVIHIAALANDFDVDGDTISVAATPVSVQPLNGTVVHEGGGIFRYTPDADFTGRDVFAYRVCDPSFQCVEAQVLVIVTPVNDAPVAVDDAVATPRDTARQIAVLANDWDIDGDALDLARIVVAPRNGAVEPALDRTVFYVPASGFVGIDRFVYEVCDPSGACAVAGVTIAVGLDNLGPSAVDDNASTPRATPVVIDVTANDADPEGAPLVVAAMSRPLRGDVAVDGDMQVTYTPDDDFTGLDTFTYTVCDDQDVCATARVSVNVTPTGNRAPVAVDDFATTTVATPVTVVVLANDYDPDGDAPRLASVGTPSWGVVVPLVNGSVVYTPPAGYVGRDTFTIAITDGRGGTATSVVTVRVLPAANKAPVANDDTYAVVGGATVTLRVLLNDTDPDNDVLTIIAATDPMHGTVNIQPDGSLKLVVDAGVTGTDHFTYTISDGRGGFASATVTLTYPAEPRPPLAVDDWTETDEDVGLLVVVLANDSNPDGGAMTVANVSQPLHGTTQLLADQTVLYTPDANHHGPDSFTYDSCNQNGVCATARVTVLVNPVDDAPLAVGDVTTAIAALPVVIDVLANDSDPDGDILAIERITTQPPYGQVSIVAGGVRYIADAGFVGTDLFRYEVCDPTGLCDEALVVVHVGSEQQAPVAVDDVATTPADVPATISVLGNDYDPDGDLLILSSVGTPLHGTATISGDAVIYRPDNGFFGIDTFWYTVCDDATVFACATASVTVDVRRGINRTPVATDDQATTVSGTPVQSNVLANDFDPDGDAVFVWAIGTPVGGTVVVAGDGTVTYQPRADWSGTERIVVTIADGRGGFAESVLEILVLPAENRAPEANDDSYRAFPGLPLELDVLTNDSDPDGDALAIVFVFQPSQGEVVFDDLGNLVYTADATASVTDRFSYTVSDGRGGFDTAHVDITFPAGNLPPTAVDDFAMVVEEGSVLVIALGNDFDPDGQDIFISTIDQPMHGTAVLNPDGTLSYSPDDDYTGPDGFTYVLCDTTKLCTSGIVTIDVRPANDPPAAFDDTAVTTVGTPVSIPVMDNDADIDNDSVELTRITFEPVVGTAVVDGDLVVYTPPAGFVGDATFMYEICDAAGLCDRAWVRVVVGGTNNPPVAVDDFAATLSGQQVLVPILDNDSDPDGDEFRVVDVAPNGDADALVVDGILLVRPHERTSDDVVLAYTICDDNELCAVGFVFVDVTRPEDLPPVAIDDAVNTTRNESVRVNVRRNDYDPDGDPVTVEWVALPPHGVATIEADQEVLYVPETGFVGPVTFDYRINDGRNRTAVASVTVYITAAQNAPPVTVNDTYTVVSSDPMVLDVLVNDSDPDGDPLRFNGITQPRGGVITLGADQQTLVFTPTPGHSGTETFRYNITDGLGHSTHGTVTLIWPAPNLPPSGTDDVLTTWEDRAIVANVVLNDLDPDDAAVQFRRIDRPPAHGSATVVSAGVVRYQPRADFHGRDSFSYIICDDDNACTSIEVLVEVLPLADAPVARDDTAATLAGGPTGVQVLLNDDDADGDVLTVTRIVVAPQSGTAFVDGGTNVVYTPSTDEPGSDFLVYEACDPTNLCATAMVRITNGGDNAVPLANADTATTPELTPVQVAVLANDSDVDGDMLAVASVGRPLHGTATIDGQNVVFAPSVDFTGTDSFWYMACDAGGLCASARVTITVTPGPNRSPLALDDFATTPFDTAVTVDVVANDIDPDGDVVRVTSVGDPLFGQVIVNRDGAVVYTPREGFSGRDEVRVTVGDGRGGWSSSTLYVLVLPATNTLPVAVDDAYDVDGTAVRVLDVLANDSDADGDTLTILAVVQPESGVVSPGTGADAGRLVLTPVAGASGVETFRYLVTDNRGGYAEAEVVLTYPSPNLPPIAHGEVVETPEDTGVLIRVLLNDSDPEGGALSLESVGEAGRGTVTISTGGTVVYQPDPDFHGADAFAYTICDPAGACSTTHVSVTVVPVNDAPLGVDDHVTTTADEGIIIDVVANDIDADFDPLHVDKIVVAPVHGSAVLLPDGTVRYVPGANLDDHVDTFTYEVCDEAGACDTALVTIAVGDDNAMPIAVDDTAAAVSGQPVLIDVRANDSDTDGDVLTIVRAGPAPHGRATTDGQTVVYQSDAAFVGVDSFLYEVCDASDTCATATVVVTVARGMNHAPVAIADVASTSSGVAVQVPVLANDFDIDGDAIRVLRFAAPMHGQASVDAAGILTYVSSADFVGTETFRVVIVDASGATAEADLVVHVTGANRPPVALDDTETLRAGPIAIDVLGNDSDPDGDDLVIIAVTQPAGATVVFDGDGLVFTALDLDTTGPRTHVFNYVVSDRRGGLDGATVVIAPPPDNLPPVGVGDYAATPEDTGVIIDVRANDFDPEGEGLTVSAITTEPRFGTATILEDGSILYVPNTNRNGPETFRYRVCDSATACVEVVVRVDVLAVNDAPLAVADAFATPSDTAVAMSVLANDRDPDGDVMSVAEIVSGPANGTAVIGNDSVVTYTPNAGFRGIDRLVYQVCDPSGACAEAEVTIDTGHTNRMPVAADDSAETGFGEAVDIAVLDNDTDPDGDTLTIVAAHDGVHGDVEHDGTVVTYTPDADFTGVDTFSYTVCDAAGLCAVAIVTVDVADGHPNRPPVAADDIGSARTGVAVQLPLLANDFDPDGDAIAVVDIEHPQHGEASVDRNGVLTYNSTDGFIGLDIFRVTIEDDFGLRATSLAVIHVLAQVNRAPLAVDDFRDVPEEVSTEIDVRDNDSDPDGDALRVIVATMPGHGVVRFGADGDPVYTPDAGFFGVDSFTYVVWDGKDGRDEAVVTLRVGDRDGDGLSDRMEDNVTLTDPDNRDTDGDGLWDGEEIEGGDRWVYDADIDTNPLDADTDDDGLSDGDEVHGWGPLDGIGPTDPLNPDSDDDGVADGVEVGVDTAIPGGESHGVPFVGTDIEVWTPDLDTLTTTNPLDDDSDDDGLLDGTEDDNGNGRWDGDVGGTGTPGIGETDPTLVDTDGDGIQDGTESGLAEPEGDDTDLDVFKPDLDPNTTTDPRDLDTDDGSVFDGDEDRNSNGRIDDGEINPSWWFDDVPKIVTGGQTGCASGDAGGMAFVWMALLGLVFAVAVRRRRTEDG